MSNLDELAKRTMEVQTIGASVTTTTGVEKDSVLDELSSSSNFAQNTQLEQVTALDNPSNKSSNLDKLLMEEAVEKQLDEVQHAQPVTKTQESISPASRAIAPSPAAPEPAAVTKSEEAFAPSPADAEYKRLITETDLELKRLGWGKQQGRDYLLKVYSVRSRHLLRNEQLRDFLHYQESQQ